MIVVTTPTGKIGSQVIPHLLAAKESVRFVVRDASRLAPEVRANVDVVTRIIGRYGHEGKGSEGCRKRLLGGASVFLRQ